MQSENRELAFFGQITASVTHELNNIMAVINEITGLLSDIINDSNPEQLPSYEDLIKIQQKLTIQIERGRSVIKHLNSFAHGADEPSKTFDLNAVIENLVNLSRRLAYLKKIELQSAVSSEPIILVASPFRLQLALFTVIHKAFDWVSDNKIMTISTQADINHARVIIGGLVLQDSKNPTNRKSVKNELMDMKCLIEGFSWRLEIADDENTSNIILVLPISG
jgi:C4-dicarboxylate-specific signal transduction histidine kinase